MGQKDVQQHCWDCARPQGLIRIVGDSGLEFNGFEEVLNANHHSVLWMVRLLPGFAFRQSLLTRILQQPTHTRS